MFELAAGRYLAEKIGKRATPILEFKNISGTFRKELILEPSQEIICSPKTRYHSHIFRILRKIASLNKCSSWAVMKVTGIYFSDVIGYDDNLESINPRAIYGYFQTCRFANHLPQIEQLLNFSSEDDKAVFQAIIDELNLKNPLGVHIRRGDYVQEIHGIGLLSDSYFEQIISSLGNSDRECWIISDNPEQLEDLISKIHYPVRILSELNRFPAFASILVLSKFHELIISNSTFSLAAALLGSSEKTVHYPEPWFRNLTKPALDIPGDWIRHNSIWFTQNS